MSLLLLLAPDIQEAMLTLQHRLRGIDLKRGKLWRPIAAKPDWQTQRAMWGDWMARQSGAG